MHLRLANPSELEPRCRLNYAEWGGRLSLEQYLEREAGLRACEFARGMRTWLLEAEGQILASCETYRVPSFLGSEEGVTHSVASVFVEPALRGRGYARAMMSRLVAALGAEGAQGSILFSDVGVALYAQAGYVARPSVDCVWRAQPGDQSAELLTDAVAAVRLLAPRLRFRVATTARQVEWHRARSRFYANAFAKRPPDVIGARTETAAVLFVPDYKNECLRLLALARGRSAEETAAVLEQARREAAAAGLGEVRGWENGHDAAQLPGAVTQPRADSIPMIVALSAFSADDWVDYNRALWV